MLLQTSWMREISALRKAESFLCEQNMGATAIGTGITASPGYAEKVAVHLAKIIW